jgi:hypothetical protein
LTPLEQVRAALSGLSANVSSEAELQLAVGVRLTERGIAFEREVRLDNAGRDRVDFLVGGIAVELKVTGSNAEIFRQLGRYALHESITDVVLVTTQMKHSMPETANGKPVHVIRIARRLA